jgi:D-hydroxyproline dehydrogenase subunit gamma
MKAGPARSAGRYYWETEMMRRMAADNRPLVTITVDGVRVEVRDGDPLATALALAGFARLRTSPGSASREGAPRAAFCHMGACQECVVHVDGHLRQSCQTAVRGGMVVELRGVP